MACAELKLDEEFYQTPGFSISPWKLGRGVMDQGRMIGQHIVYYSENPGRRAQGTGRRVKF